MKAFAKGIAAALIAAMSAAPAAALAESAAPDAASTGKTYTLMGYEPELDRKWGEHAFFQTLADKSGLEFTFRQYGDYAVYQQAKGLAFASGDLPDAFFKGAFTAQEELKYGAAGQLVDLAPLIDEHAPAVSAILAARADWKQAITQPDGKITSLPSLNGYERQAYLWINKTWLDNLGLAAPRTFAELADTLKAFKSNDPNANGKADEIPLGFLGPWEAKFLLHGFGLAPNDYNIEVSDGKVVFAPFDERYALFIEAMASLNSSGLIDRDAFRQGQSARQTLLSDASTATLGCFVSIAPYALLKLEVAEQYTAMLPMEYHDARVYRELLAGVTRGTFAITSACGNPGELLGWADYLYTDEGGRLGVSGVENVDYRWLPAGTWEWITDEFTTIETLLRDRVMRTDVLPPGLDPADFQRRTSLAIESRVRREGDALRPYLVTPFPMYWPTDDTREEEIAALQAVLGPAVDDGIAKFITGETPYTPESWRAFLEDLRAKGAERITELFQNIYDETVKE